MEGTLSGAIGRFAAPLAMAELDPEQDLVATQLRQMEARLVTSKTLALLNKMKTATKMHVQCVSMSTPKLIIMATKFHGRSAALTRIVGRALHRPSIIQFCRTLINAACNL
jgi:hypothetical protein